MDMVNTLLRAGCARNHREAEADKALHSSRNKEWTGNAFVVQHTCDTVGITAIVIMLMGCK